MAISKNGNGMMHGDEPASAAGAPPAAHAAPGTAHRTGATRASRIAGRPARAAGDELAAADAEVVRRAGSARAERKYSFNALLAAGFIGYVVGRLFSR